MGRTILGTTISLRFNDDARDAAASPRGNDEKFSQ
jgi:hypothetical protein